MLSVIGGVIVVAIIVSLCSGLFWSNDNAIDTAFKRLMRAKRKAVGGPWYMRRKLTADELRECHTQAFQQNAWRVQ